MDLTCWFEVSLESGEVKVSDIFLSRDEALAAGVSTLELKEGTLVWPEKDTALLKELGLCDAKQILDALNDLKKRIGGAETVIQEAMGITTDVA